MRIFNIKDVVLNLPQEKLGLTVAAIKRHEAAVEKAGALPNVEKMRNIARRSGAVNSCALGNVFLSEDEEIELFEKGAEPHNFAQRIVKGYCDALDLIDQVYDQTELSISFISTLHYLMYKPENPAIGGKFKDTQNYIQERMADGSYQPVFTPAPPEEAYALLDSLVYQFNECAKDPEVDKLLLIAVFMCDFLCIHPYNHGNGRVSRLLLHFLLKKYGFLIDDYFAVSYILDRQVADYLASFKLSGVNWREGTNDYLPYVHFLLRMVHAAYRRLDYIVGFANSQESLEQKVYRVIKESAGAIGYGVLESVLFAESREDIKKTAEKLLDEGRIVRASRGREIKFMVN